MITINSMSKDFSKVDIYRLTRDNNITSCKDVADGTKITVVGYLEYDDTKDDGKTETVFAFMDDTGKCYACTSKTFARNVKEIAEIMDGENFSIIKESGVTKAGKDFIMASLAY